MVYKGVLVILAVVLFQPCTTVKNGPHYTHYISEREDRFNYFSQFMVELSDCGAVMVTSNIFMTACHCLPQLAKVKPHEFQYVQPHAILDNKDTKQLIKIVDYWPKPANFCRNRIPETTSDVSMDFGFVRVEKSVEEKQKKYGRPAICEKIGSPTIPIFWDESKISLSELNNNALCYLAGMGQTNNASDKGLDDSHIYHRDLHVIFVEKFAWEDIGENGKGIKNLRVYYKEGTTACSGDSGSPIICEYKGRQYWVAGQATTYGGRDPQNVLHKNCEVLGSKATGTPVSPSKIIEKVQKLGGSAAEFHEYQEKCGQYYNDNWPADWPTDESEDNASEIENSRIWLIIIIGEFGVSLASRLL